MSTPSSATIAIGPAGGALAGTLVDIASRDHRVVVLHAMDRHMSDASTRSPPPRDRIVHRQFDFFSRGATRDALSDVDALIYLTDPLVESGGRQGPHMFQGNTADYELNCADNIQRAIDHHSIERLIWLRLRHSGFTTVDDDELHGMFAPSAADATIVQLPLVLQQKNPLIRALQKTLRRSPMLGLPASDQTTVAPVDAREAGRFICQLTTSSAPGDRTVALQGPEYYNLRRLVDTMRQALSSMCLLPRISLLPFGVFARWLATISRVATRNIRPWLHSFQPRQPARPRDSAPTTLSTSVEDSLARLYSDTTQIERSTSDGSASTLAHTSEASRQLTVEPDTHTYRAHSVQRLPLPHDRNADWVAREYTDWLPRLMWPILNVTTDETRECRFFLRFLPWPLLILSFVGSTSDHNHNVFHITGGLLTSDDSDGRLEFRDIPGTNTVLACVHNFEPRLPRFIYRWTQALFHAWVMRRFRDHLTRIEDIDD